MGRIRFGFVILLIFIFFAGTVYSEEAEIGNFEMQLDSKKPTTTTTKKTPDQETEKKGEPGKASEGLKAGIMETLAGIFLAGAYEMAQDDDFGYTYRYLKKNEIPAVPTFRLEGNYQFNAADTQALDGRVEVGYLMIGAEGEYRKYWESKPKDELNTISTHLLVRALFSEVFQINLALGEKFIWGDVRHDGFEIGFPFYILFGKHFLWDVRPFLAFVHGHDVYDISTGISYKYKLFGVRVGYRGMNVDNLTLHGPEAGLFIQY